MKGNDIISACNLVVESTHGISLKEQFLLREAPRVKVSENKRLSNVEIVSLGVQAIYNTLGRKNITPKDLKTAVINMIEL